MNPRNLTLLIAVAAGIGLGVVGMAALRDDGQVAGRPDAGAVPAPVPGDAARVAADSEQLADVVESLVTLLDQEISERNVLAEEIRRLRADVDRLQGGLGAGDVSIADRTAVAAQFRQPRAVPQSQAERLQAAGFSEREAAAIERRAAEATMQQMMLDDRARREGWINTPRYFEEIQSIESGEERVRGYLGDDAYDRYLYASGNSNRLSVRSVVPTSPAAQAGLQPGDVLLTYGEQRVFDGRQLVELRSGGQPGEPVTVELLRDGQTVTVTLPRGPIGINTGAMRVDPAAIGPDTE